ncbi:ExeM/NucH family extracellular endonuclease [Methylosoma difficile]
MTEKNHFKRHPLALAMFATLQPLQPVLLGGLALLGLSGEATAFTVNPASVFINEIHYDNSGNDIGEAVEIAGPAGTDLTGWQLVRYNGNVPTAAVVYTLSAQTSALPASIPGTLGSMGVVTVTFAADGLQNGGNDGIALVDGGGNVVQFLSYEGVTTTSTGAASGKTSTDIGVSETSSSPAGHSLQLTGSGNVYSDFTWTTPAPNTFGAANNGQTFTTITGSVNPSVSLAVSAKEGTETDTTVITVTATASEAVTSNQTVNLTVSGTNVNAGDYSLNNPSITILSGTTSGSVSFTVLNDNDIESLETAAISISGVSSGLTSGSPASQNITLVDNDACGTAATKISTVQGTDNGSAHALNGVAGTTIEGIVVGDYQGVSATSLRGFFVQEENADVDGNAATSEGIFIFDGINGKPSVKVGDKVRVTGTRSEYFNMTQLGTLTDVQICASNQTLPTAASLTLPVPNVPTGDLAAATAAINNYYEAFEGMLVSFPTTLKVSEYFELERYGQLLLGQGGRIQTFTNASNPSVSGYVNHQINVAKRQILLDDKNDTENAALSNSQALFYPTDGAGGITDGLSTANRFRGGDTISNLTGVLHWSWAGRSGTDAWRIRPVDEVYDYVFTAANKRKATPPSVGGTLKVASFNVLNYFTTIDTTAGSSSGPCGADGLQDCRGADSAIELSQQKAKAGAALCGLNADIIGLMEVENNASASLQDLADAANSVCGAGTYDYIPTGVIGTDAIKVGLLYKTATVAPINSFALLNSSVSSNFIDTKNRPSLAQSFEQLTTGERLTVAVNHLKSKGSDCNDISFDGNVSFDVDAQDGQGNCNITRKKAAEVLVSWLATYPTGIIDNDNLIIGDLNSYAKEDPVKAIENGGYTNLVKKFSGASAYSYVFDGQLGYLDHALASSSLVAQVTGAGDWHINADEPPAFDYNDAVATTGEASFEAKPSATPLYAANAYRTSDHDPVMIGLQLASVINTINGSPAKDTLTGTTGNDRISGLAGADKLTGSTGADAFVYALTTDGIDTVTDFVPGEDVIDLTALLLNIGYQGDNPIGDGIVKFAASGSNSVVYIDVDGAGATAQRALLIVNNVSVASLNNPSNFKF